MTRLNKLTFIIILLNFLLISQVYTQEDTDKSTKKVNFGYSTNPPAKNIKKTDKTKEPQKSDNKKTSKDNNKEVDNIIDTVQPESDLIKANLETTENNKTDTTEEVTIAKKTIEITNRANKAKLLPTEIYKVGVGDVLFINLQDTAAKYYTVLIDGTIDYPLAGKLVSVIDLTTDEIEDLLREKIKLYENPQVIVKIREYASHEIQVQGLAKKTGKHYLQREAMPLVVVKTMVGASADATKVRIERENTEPKILNLSESSTDTFLISKGDRLIFENDELPTGNNSNSSIAEFYRVGKKICSGGTKKYHKGITLVQAVFEVCGELNKKLKELSITRKTPSGVFVTKNYKFKQILNGKIKDPVLQPGDMIDSVK